jgi:N-acetylmuramic acid 6-phosphate etherase
LERFNRVQYRNDVVIEVQPQEQHPMSSADCNLAMKTTLSREASLATLASPFPKTARFPIDVVVGPEFVTGSSE